MVSPLACVRMCFCDSSISIAHTLSFAVMDAQPHFSCSYVANFCIHVSADISILVCMAPERQLPAQHYQEALEAALGQRFQSRSGHILSNPHSSQFLCVLSRKGSTRDEGWLLSLSSDTPPIQNCFLILVYSAFSYKI